MATMFLTESMQLLERTPAVLQMLLRDLPESWTLAADGPDAWSARIVVAHLIHGERTDWIPRLVLILEQGTERPFEPFDMQAHFREQEGKSMGELLDLFQDLRADNLSLLRQLNLNEEQLQRQGMHPALGVVTARELIATWTAHDQAHLVQISRTFARRYRQETGPWAAYMSVMK